MTQPGQVSDPQPGRPVEPAVLEVLREVRDRVSAGHPPSDLARQRALQRLDARIAALAPGPGDPHARHP